MSAAPQYQSLLIKIDEFIRKYYKNQLIRGLITTGSIFLAFFLLVSLLEYIGHFSIAIRTVLFYCFVSLNAFVLTLQVLIPLLKLNKFGKTINHADAAIIIGKHFTTVEDKLLNLLQLQSQQATPSHTTSPELLMAGIDQRIQELKPIPFSAAIDLRENTKYLKYLLWPFVLFVALWIYNSNIFKESASRLVNHQVFFEKAAPFQFTILNKQLSAVQQHDFSIQLQLSGDEIPENVYISIGANEYRLDKINTVNFQYVFKNLQSNVPFHFVADGYSSKEYLLSVLPNPLLMNFSIALHYPAYTSKKDEMLNNTGDIIIPAGTKVSWDFGTQNTENIRLNFRDTAFTLLPSGENSFTYQQVFLQPNNYAVSTSNKYLKSSDSVRYAITVIPDVHPSVEVNERQDSINRKLHYFAGSIKDDYGFTKLIFHYNYLENRNDTSLKQFKGHQQISIPVNKSLTQDRFFFQWDLSNLVISAGDQIEYYFEIFDNDGVNGIKSTKSVKQIFKAPSFKEIAENTERNNKEIKNELMESIVQAKNIQKELDALNKKLIDKKQLSWEEKKKLQELMSRQKELQQKIEEINRENQQNNEEKSEYKQLDENLLEKQQQLEELMKNVLPEDMKEKMKELEKMMQQSLDKEKLQEAIDKMKLDNKDMEKELDRSLELFKQLEVEQKLNDAVKNLNELKQKEEELSQKTLEKNADNKQLNEEQKQIQEKMEAISKELKDLDKKNNELEKPNELPNTQQKQQDAKENMEQSQESLEKKKNKNASEKQKKAAQDMKEMADQLQAAQEKMEEQQEGEDMDALRDILENLVHLSFDQEALMLELNSTARENPNYIKLIQRQKKLKDDADMIEDSLLALSKRNPQIKSVVNKEISAINLNMEKAIDAMVERQIPETQNRQQFSMTSVNNLALMLNEALQNMQQKARQKSNKPGNGSCKNPGGTGGKKPSMAKLRQQQEELNQKMDKIRQQLEKNGKQPGKSPQNGQKGGTGTGGNGNLSMEIAKMAAQQESIRRELQKMMKNKDGKGVGGNLAQQMEETETDLVNKRITPETIRRQKEILTRLLESEKAERERELDEQRQSNESKNENFSNPNEFLEYNRLKQKEVELLKTIPLHLAPFYKNKVTQYFNQLDER